VPPNEASERNNLMASFHILIADLCEWLFQMVLQMVVVK